MLGLRAPRYEGRHLSPLRESFLEQNTLEGTLNVLGVFGRHHVIGDDKHLNAEVEKTRCYGLHDRGLA